MIDNDVVESTSELLKDTDEEVRQQAALLIGSFSLAVRGRDRIPAAFEGLQLQLNDPVLKVREACGWALCMLSHNREGCDLLV